MANDFLLSVPRMIDQACARTGLSDYGASSFREGLEYLAESVNVSRATKPPRAFIAQRIGDLLVNRLQTIGAISTNAEIQFRRIQKPIFIIGTGRAGSTFVSHILAADSANRSLTKSDARETISRTARSAQHIFQANRFGTSNSPTKHIHHEAPEDPTSCTAVFAHDFKSFEFEHYGLFPEYSTWFDNCSKASAYAYHKQVLQLLSHDGDRWILKTAQHSLAIAELLKAYPDAKFIQLHRDPFVSLNSRVGFVTSLHKRIGFPVNEHQTRQRWAHLMKKMIVELAEFRANTNRPVFDVNYEELITEPFEIIERLYRFFDMEMTIPAKAAIQNYIAENPQGKYGQHKYTITKTDLGNGVEEIFEEYKRRYAA